MKSIINKNQTASSVLFQIENGLREFIISELEELDGPYWYKTRLPPDVLEAYKNGIKYERKQSFLEFVPHHPIYYLDFPHIQKVIENNQNWQKCFKNIFGRKEHVQALLSQLEPVRNKVAHNRVVSDFEVNLLENTLVQFKNYITPPRYDALLHQLSFNFSISHYLKHLDVELKTVLSEIANLQLIKPLITWPDVKRAWWFDSSYIELDTDAIRVTFSLIEEYVLLPRNRGAGLSIRRWVNQTDILKLGQDSSIQLQQIESNGTRQ